MTENRPYVCDASTCAANWCGKRFARRHDLNRHIKVHLGIREYACRYCDKTFGQSNGLEVHEKTHVGMRTHCCPLSHVFGGTCKVWPFRDDSSYRRHWQNQHAPRPPRFTCPIRNCTFTGARKSLLRNHLRDRHNRALPRPLRERQPRGAHGVTVPEAIRVQVYDSQLEEQGYDVSTVRGGSRSNSTRINSRSSSTVTPPSSSPLGEHDICGQGYDMSVDAAMSTPASRNYHAPEDDIFAFRVPSPSVPSQSIAGRATESNSPDEVVEPCSAGWTPPFSGASPAPMMGQHVPHIAPMSVPMFGVDDLSSPFDFGYNAVPAAEPFSVLDNGAYDAASSPIPAAGTELRAPVDFMEMWNLLPEGAGFDHLNVQSSSWNIDPDLL